jgi:hypothetical protein
LTGHGIRRSSRGGQKKWPAIDCAMEATVSLAEGDGGYRGPAAPRSTAERNPVLSPRKHPSAGKDTETK